VSHRARGGIRDDNAIRLARRGDKLDAEAAQVEVHIAECVELRLAARGLSVIDDGSLGFWVALQEEYGPITQQRLLGA
jgi:hypothetical protein